MIVFSRVARPVLAGLFVGVLCTACATAPFQEMSDARQALQAARDAGIGQHAPHYLHETEVSLQDAERGLSEGGDGYGKAREKAIAAKQSALAGRTVALAISAAKSAVAEAVAAGKLSDATQMALRDAVVAAGQGNDVRAVELATQAKTSAEADLTR